jgi:hypothetical protein
MGLPERSSWFPGAEVDDAWVSSWRHHHVGLYLADKPSHMGVDVDGLACPLHCHMVCGCQTRGQSSLPNVVLSHHAVVGGGTFSGSVKPLGLDS